MVRLAIRYFHFLGQNFAKAHVQFTNKEGKLDYVWATSWVYQPV